jgi:tetratricopeptide (TPR) repeat protein
MQQCRCGEGTPPQYGSACACCAGNTAEACASCEAAAKYDSQNSTIVALLAELQLDAFAAHKSGSFVACKERAALRFKAGHFAAAAEAYAALASCSRASTVERAAAASNRALCCMQLSQHQTALSACQTALELLAPERNPAGNVSANSQATDAIDLLEPSSLDKVVTGATAALEASSEDARNAARLACKVLGRAASCAAHMRKSQAAHDLYKAGAELAGQLGDVQMQAAYQQDAQHVAVLAHKSSDAGEQGASGLQLDGGAVSQAVDGGGVTSDAGSISTDVPECALDSVSLPDSSTAVTCH